MSSLHEQPLRRRGQREADSGTRTANEQQVSVTDTDTDTDKYEHRRETPTSISTQALEAVEQFDFYDRVIALALTFVSLFTRLYQIGKRDIVTWDETHFGKFGAYYVNRTFYHDVHPPLAKMLVGLGEFLSGHNGSFTYASGAVYPEHVNYTFQRGYVAVFGAMTVPLAYRTCRLLGFGKPAATMAASFIVFDNAMCLISRFILLDPPLLCFTAMSLLGYSGFMAQRHRAFEASWWRWLAFTGISLGLVVSSKWTGLFVIALVGLCTIEELLKMFSDSQTPAATQLRHWAARVLCLIVVPIAIYLASFGVHFALLNHRGTGDFKMPSSFQMRQWGNVVGTQPHEVSFGSNVTLRSHLPGFGLLNANGTRRFPDRDREVIAGGVPGKVVNNWWTLVSANRTWENASAPILHVHSGQLVRLAHINTGHFLRTGRSPPYNMGWDRRVFVDGNKTKSDVWDIWRIVVDREESAKSRGKLRAVTTNFRLYNAVSGCLLQATPASFPENVARKFSEVICTDANTTRSEGTLWNIEQVRDTRLKRVALRSAVKRKFLRDFLWINREMAISNNGLTTDPDKYKQAESSPWSWPLLFYPMRMGPWTDDAIKYYEIGNPVLWWASSFCCLVLYPLQLIYWAVQWQRRQISSRWQAGELLRFWDTTKLLWGGWALNYLPFYLMGRVTYLHHYLPALYFALLLLAFEIQCFVHWYMPPRAIWSVAGITILAAAGVFWMFSPLTFGWERPVAELGHLCWLPWWNVVRDQNLF
ncbi:Protein O-mannosyltransferase 2 [Coemansia interrupta]|uniref:Dolichyl-phosphate-mannose--protein mannosyltransferase n=1 Tax=Coemansia interrupta TaxID=1126814 RepID=A0A9W8HGU1_9FUNG|nr:Protein O-mannosyltransferase 2 [Coemansia interrupta]